jgi:hypothetical protein
MKKNACLFLLFVTLCITHSQAQVPEQSLLFRQLYSADSLLFQVGFNHCTLQPFELLIDDDFEFYHDKAGATLSRQAFLDDIRNGLCKNNYQAVRVLEPGSLQVFPLEKNGVLYGAVQTGTHHFYAVEKDSVQRYTSSARFTHVWILESGHWKLKRALSYDHGSGNAIGRTSQVLSDTLRTRPARKNTGKDH